MKKFLLVIALAAILATGTAFADHPSGFGIGVQGGYGGGIGGALTLKFPSMPIFWAVDAGAWANYLWLGLAGDYYFIDSAIAADIGLHWYLGVGGYVNLGVGDPLNVAVGARVPIGLSWQPIPLLEIYLQIVPSVGLSVLPSVGLWPNFWSGNLGLRLWF